MLTDHIPASSAIDSIYFFLTNGIKAEKSWFYTNSFFMFNKLDKSEHIHSFLNFFIISSSLFLIHVIGSFLSGISLYTKKYPWYSYGFSIKSKQLVQIKRVALWFQSSWNFISSYLIFLVIIKLLCLIWIFLPTKLTGVMQFRQISGWISACFISPVQEENEAETQIKKTLA